MYDVYLYTYIRICALFSRILVVVCKLAGKQKVPVSSKAFGLIFLFMFVKYVYVFVCAYSDLCAWPLNPNKQAFIWCDEEWVQTRAKWWAENVDDKSTSSIIYCGHARRSPQWQKEKLFKLLVPIIRIRLAVGVTMRQKKKILSPNDIIGMLAIRTYQY